MYCASAAGRLLPCYVVYKSEHLWSIWTEGRPAGTRYNRSRSGLFDTCCFTDGFETVFIPCAKSLLGKKVIIGNNLISHFTERVLSLAEKHNIKFACLPPNSTRLLQPFDFAFYGPLKSRRKRLFDDWKCSRRRHTSALLRDVFPHLLKRLRSNFFTGEENHCDNLVSGFLKCEFFLFVPNAAPERKLTLMSGSSTMAIWV